jgi:hypothetical protein
MTPKRKIKAHLLTGLERSFGVENAFTACDLTVLRLGIVSIGDDLNRGIAIVEHAGKGWREIARFEMAADALRALGRILDLYWDDIPIDEIDEPSPTLVNARERSPEVTYRTANGVRDAEELLDKPGELVPFDQRWPDFSTATSWLADEAEYSG